LPRSDAEQPRLAAAGVNSTEQMKQNILGLTFRQQAEEFLEQSRTRKRKPISNNTYHTWRSCFDKWLLPNIGSMLLQDVNNKSVKQLVVKMVDAELAPKSIENYVGLVKLVVASAIDENGEEIYPRKWNHDFIDLPEVDEQNTPTVTAEQLTQILTKAEGQDRTILLLAAATGLRLGELKGLRVEDVKNNGKTLEVLQQNTRDGLTDRLKTKNAYRSVDVHAVVAAELIAHIAGRSSGLVFVSRKGAALNPSNLRNRLLYPILDDLGINKGGLHIFRRFRESVLLASECRKLLIDYWMGHDNDDMSTRYGKQLLADKKYRKTMAQQAGIGFEVPLAVQSVQNAQREEVTLAA